MSSDITVTLAPFQKTFVMSDERVVSIIAAKGVGKAQPLYEPVLTPDGFVPMGSLKVGDKVIGSNGKPCNVTGVFPQGKIPTVCVVLTDGSYTHCSYDHLWSVQTGSMKNRGNKFKVMTTKEILDDLYTKQGYCKWYLPLVEPIEKSEKEYEIPPYSMGVILGDGGITKPSVIISTKDLDILERVSKECSMSYKYQSGYDYVLTNGDRDHRGYNTNRLVTYLRSVGLIGKKSNEKHIPDKYFEGSIEQRIDLLRGLMDTDGYVMHTKTGSFCTTSKRLADDVLELCRGLGLTPVIRTKRPSNTNHLTSYNITINAPFNPFWVKRKAEKYNIHATQGRVRGIKNIFEIGLEQSQCISVDAPDSLYVTRDYILTHNTWSGALYICREIADQPNGQGLVMFNTLQQARDIFAQDIEPRFKELNWPYNFNQQTLVCKVFDTLIHFRSAEPSALERIESVAYHWGWADEASYYSPDAFKTFFSRIRKGDARVRVTSMPDEPDHFMYSFLEGMEGTMFELSLADNPDRAFADRYEKFLRVTYSGAQLERYLSGKRVSLSGEGLFSVESHMRRPDIVYNPDEDVTLSWDFNVEYRAVSAWQVVGIAPDGNKILGCVRSWQMKGATVYEDAEALSDELRSHRARIILHGDASGESRSAQTTTSMWKTIRDVFNRKLENVRYIVPKSNPPVKDTIQCINWALRQGLVVFNDNERNVYMSLSACKADKYGEIDKSIDYTANTTARSHEADTARYAVFETFKHVYPGNKGGFWIL
jgi:hypothetical protein